MPFWKNNGWNWIFWSEIEDLEEEIQKLGFRRDGKETLYNGVTGKMMNVKIYVGNMYYLKLKYMVSNKLHGSCIR